MSGQQQWNGTQHMVWDLLIAKSVIYMYIAYVQQLTKLRVTVSCTSALNHSGATIPRPM